MCVPEHRWDAHVKGKQAGAVAHGEGQNVWLGPLERFLETPTWRHPLRMRQVPPSCKQSESRVLWDGWVVVPGRTVVRHQDRDR